MPAEHDPVHQRILDALDEAVQNAAQVVELLYDCGDPTAGEAALKEHFGWDEVQARAVLNMQLRRVTRSEREAVAHHPDRYPPS